MALRWISKGWALHSAERPFGVHGVARLAVECLGETGWNWHVWDTAHQLRPQQGLADTLAEAKAQAERALERMTGRRLLIV